MILRLHSFQRCNVPTHTHTHTQEPAVLPFGSLISFFPRVIASALRRPRAPISSSDPPSPPPEKFFTVSILLAIHSKTSRNKPPDANDDHEETLQNQNRTKNCNRCLIPLKLLDQDANYFNKKFKRCLIRITVIDPNADFTLASNDARTF
jgi:hypothetical protein